MFDVHFHHRNSAKMLGFHVDSTVIADADKDCRLSNLADNFCFFF